MSGQVLTPDAIAALVDAAKEGRLPEQPAPDRGRQRRMRTVDFTRPTKFTADQERRLKRALDTFCRTASTRLSAELRMALELEVISVNQLTWSNAHAQVPSRSIACAVDVAPIGTKMLVSTEKNLVLSAIELLLGGSAGAQPRDRRMTDIDWALAKHFVERILAQLSVVWSDMAELELSAGAMDMHLDTAQMAAVSEPTLAFTIEARMDRESATIGLLLPYTAIAPVADRIAAREDADETLGGEAADAVRNAVGRVEMTVRAEVASVELPIEQVLALQPGDLLRLDARAEDGVTIFADAVPVHRGRPGRSGTRRAVQITHRLEGADS
ncbi:MAG TPA: FliM/FliN family flagellar motor switch protein [Solirubrobacteraceae bacterium]|nr:FliM/FliN family flagellar motor switch protein [Solirubrobacteraceae bacterium]